MQRFYVLQDEKKVTGQYQVVRSPKTLLAKQREFRETDMKDRAMEHDKMENKISEHANLNTQGNDG